MAKPAAGAYIQISEAEIAEDYPAPKQYTKEHEEADELVLFDDEMMGCDPEDLPRRCARRCLLCGCAVVSL